MKKQTDSNDSSINLLLISSQVELRREISNILLKNYDSTFISSNLEEGKKILAGYMSAINIVIICIPLKDKDLYIDFIANLKEVRHDIEVYIIAPNLDLASIINIANLGISKLMIEPFEGDKFINDLNNISARITKQRVYGKDIDIYEDLKTKLPNKLKLIKDIDHNESYWLMIINVDDFRQINDCYGAEVGDAISLVLSKVLSKYAINQFFRLYKLQIDEYALLITCKYNRLDYMTLVNKIVHDLMETPYYFHDKEIYYNASFGISTSEHGNKDLIRNAGVALRLAKLTKSQYIIYNTAIENQGKAKSMFWLNELRHAINHDQVILYYQPIVSNITGKIEYVEALIRIKKEDGGIYLPNEFIDISKEIRVYNQLTEIVINKAISFVKKYGCNISINLSFEDVANEKVRKFILDKLEEETEICEKIKFEFTESESITNYKLISNFIDDINKLGSKIAIDDFGSGYSNFYSILKLKINYLKLDGSLIKNIVDDQYARAIIKSIVDLTKQLGIKTVAEYVASEEIFNYVRNVEIDYSQGYYISYPLPEEELVSILRSKGQYLSEVDHKRNLKNNVVLDSYNTKGTLRKIDYLYTL